MKSPTKENVLNAYNNTKCEETKKTLRRLWPNVLEIEDFYNIRALSDHFINLFTKEQAREAGFKDNLFMQILEEAEDEKTPAGRGFYLSTYECEWTLRKLENEETVGYILTPIRKK